MNCRKIEIIFECETIEGVRRFRANFREFGYKSALFNAVKIRKFNSVRELAFRVYESSASELMASVFYLCNDDRQQIESNGFDFVTEIFHNQDGSASNNFNDYIKGH